MARFRTTIAAYLATTIAVMASSHIPIAIADPIDPPQQRYKVRIESIRVTKSESYGLFGEPGVEAEWRLRLVVNGEAREWANDHVRDNTDHLIGFDFYVNVVNPATNVSVRASGYEIDDTSPNDNLPAAEATHGSADNWGIGQTRTLRASDGDFDYTVYYTVTPLEN